MTMCMAPDRAEGIQKGSSSPARCITNPISIQYYSPIMTPRRVANSQMDQDQTSNLIQGRAFWNAASHLTGRCKYSIPELPVQWA